MTTVYPKMKRAPRQAVAPVNLQPASAGVRLRRRHAAGGGALERGAGDRHALTLAGVLALARGPGALAGALALAGVDAVALVGALGMRRAGDRAGREQGGRRADDDVLVH